ncbi:MAG: hypothetical protein ACFFD1_11235 [Candidatus Thorarchaeota archaeon]
MIHLIGLVFTNGTGFRLYADEIFSNENQNILIWGLTQAITSFALINLKSKGKLELLAGKYRIIFYDPFLDLDKHPDYAYSLVGIQDMNNNLDMCLYKMKKIHDLILTSGLQSNIGFLTFGDQLSNDLLQKIATIAEKTSTFPDDLKRTAKGFLNDFISAQNDNIYFLAVIFADIDEGIIEKCFSKKLLEDSSFTETLLTNLMAESPFDTEYLWLERVCPKTIRYSLNLKTNIEIPKESFIIYNLDEGKTDYQILIRVVHYSSTKESVIRQIKTLINKLNEIIVQFKPKREENANNLEFDDNFLDFSLK